MKKTTDKIVTKIRRVGGSHEMLGLLYDLDMRLMRLEDGIAEIKSTQQTLLTLADRDFEIARANRDNIATLRNKLSVARKSKDYQAAYTKKNPLVTVRIATYNKAEELLTICLPSVLNQTYRNIEVIVIGDHCTDDTEKRISELADPRVTFINFSRRSMYPDDKFSRWLVAGSPGMNYGAELAKGDWIAPLDDDDEFTPDHVERLVRLAQESRAELVYGALLQKNYTEDEERPVYSNPPQLGHFSFQAAIYPKTLGFFQYDEQSWVGGEPGDWNLCRRMLMSGVTTASMEEIVGIMHMNNLNDKKHYK